MAAAAMALSLWWSTIFAKKINPLGRRGLNSSNEMTLNQTQPPLLSVLSYSCSSTKWKLLWPTFHFDFDGGIIMQWINIFNSTETTINLKTIYRSTKGCYTNYTSCGINCNMYKTEPPVYRVAIKARYTFWHYNISGMSRCYLYSYCII